MSAPYHPGQAPWPDNQSQRPDRPPPIQFRPEEQGPRDSQVLAWILRIVGLIAVAAITGFAWWYIHNDGSGGAPAGYGGDETQQQSQGEYDFRPKLPSPRVDTACSEHAYAQTKTFLADHGCVRLTRSVFTTNIEGRNVYTSVSVVEFDDQQTAQDLQDLTDQDGSGNVSDLVREGVVEIKGLKSLSGNDGYASEVQGERVTIVESDYGPNSQDGGTQKELDDVSRDALRLGAEITANGG